MSLDAAQDLINQKLESLRQPNVVFVEKLSFLDGIAGFSKPLLSPFTGRLPPLRRLGVGTTLKRQV